MPVDGRFEHMVLSCNMTSDHAILWILEESDRAFDVSLSFVIGGANYEIFVAVLYFQYAVLIRVNGKIKQSQFPHNAPPQCIALFTFLW